MKGAFDGRRAKAHIESLCALGPRPTGSRAMANQRKLLARHFQGLSLSCQPQPFAFRQPSEPDRRIKGVNLITAWRENCWPRLLLAAHYDTRPIADEDPNPKRRREPIVGANDGASGVAVLMELARLTVEANLSTGIDFVLFDAEEYVLDPDVDHLLVGSTYFADHGLEEKKYASGVVLDIVAREGAVFSPDLDSSRRAPELVEEFFTRAEDLYPDSFHCDVRTTVYDDHIPLLQAGVPALVLIDIHDPRWHTHDDVPAYCSSAALQSVGDAVWDWLCRRNNTNL